ncbi:MAG: hypothetical protein PHI84_10315 [Kiritimatiellae bacterium]|nr:hypothetical protein [Kiritimatiellia bacterium]
MTIVVAFVLGVLVTAVVCREIRRSDRTAYMSDVVAPTAQIVSEINSNIRDGETNRAFAKLQLLEDKLSRFLDGGSTPEVFISEIRKIDK